MLRKASFDPSLGIIQWLAFANGKSILSDEEALEIKKTSPQTNWDEQLDSFILSNSKDL